MSTDVIRSRRSVSGFQIIEVLLAIAVSSIVILPLLNLLNVMYFGMRNGAGPTGISSRQDVPLGFASGKQCIVASSILERALEGDTGVFTVDSLSHADLGISSTTQMGSLSFMGMDLIASLDSSSTTEPDFASFDFSGYAKSGSKDIGVKLHADTGPGYVNHTAEGLKVYAANTSVSSQAHSFAIESADRQAGLSAPELGYVFPGSNSNTNPITKKILPYRGMLIVGTQKSVLPEIHLFEKASGKVLSAIDTEYGINDISAWRDRLVILGPQDPEMQVFDISDPDRPVLASSFDFPGGSGNGRSAGIFGDILYVGRSKGGNELLTFELAAEGIREIDSLKIGASVDKIIPSSKGALLFTSNEYGELYAAVFDVGHGNRRIMRLVHLGTDLPGRVSDYACLGNQMYLSIKSDEFPLSVLTPKLK
ncbi:MAG TPA: hypothetical protein VGE62_02105 [Candidatus Paceibacterota bacterium]